MSLIMDMTQMLPARLRRDKRHEPRSPEVVVGRSNSLAIFGQRGTIIGYLLGASSQSRVYRGKSGQHRVTAGVDQ